MIFNNSSKLCEIAIKLDDCQFKVTVYGTLPNIWSGYSIIIEGIDKEGEQVFISIRKDGYVIKDDVLRTKEKFEYRDSSETLIISMELDSIFKGTSSSSCQFSNIYIRYSEQRETVKPTRTEIANSIDKTASSSIVDSVYNVSSFSKAVDDSSTNTQLNGVSAPMLVTLVMLVIMLISLLVLGILFIKYEGSTSNTSKK